MSVCRCAACAPRAGLVPAEDPRTAVMALVSHHEGAGIEPGSCAGAASALLPSHLSSPQHGF